MRPGEDFEKHAISALLAGLAFLMLIAAACRHLWPAAHPTVLRVAAACLAWMASLGMARAAVLGLHVRVAVAERVVSPAARERLAKAADAAFLVFSILTFAAGCAAFALSMSRSGVGGQSIAYAALPAGSLLTAFRLAGKLIRRENRA